MPPHRRDLSAHPRAPFPWINSLQADIPATSEGQYSSILQGLLTGFLYPLLPILFFREMPLPNFFEAEAEANGASDVVGGADGVGVALGLGVAVGGGGAGVGGWGGSALVGTEVVVSSVFNQRVQVSNFCWLQAAMQVQESRRRALRPTRHSPVYRSQTGWAYNLSDVQAPDKDRSSRTDGRLPWSGDQCHLWRLTLHELSEPLGNNIATANCSIGMHFAELHTA